MPTKLYFHDATFSGWPGTFPSGEQSAVTPTSTATGGTVLRTMNTTIGSSEVTVTTPTLAVTTVQNQLIRMFVSPVVATGDTIGLMNFWCATLETNLNVNLTLSFNIYAWNPSTGLKVAGVDGVNSGQIIAAEQSSAGVRQVYGANNISLTSFTVAAGNVLVVEVWARMTQGMSTAYSTSFYYDGTSENTTINATAAFTAAYIEFPNATLTFASLETLGATLAGAGTYSGDLSFTSYSVQTVGSAYSETRAALPSYQTGDLILGMAFRDGSTTPPTVPAGWTTLATATNTTSSAVAVRKTATSSQTFSGWSNPTTRSLPATTTNWYSVAHGNGRYVAVALGTSIAATSPDGITWTQRALPASAGWRSVVFGNGLFVAVAGGPSTTAASSPDGVTWTARTLPSSSPWTAVAFGEGVFVAVSGGISSNAAASSTNGTTWTARTLPTAGFWECVAYGNGTFVALRSPEAATSTDGFTWALQTLPVSAAWSSIAYGNGVFVAVADGTSIAITSPDGVTWTQRTLPVSAAWSAVAYGNGIFVALTSDTKGAAISSDGITWTARSSLFIPSDAIVFGDGIFCFTANGTSSAGTIFPTTLTEQFTDATSVTFGVYRGVDATTPIGNVVSATGSGTTATIPALSLSQPAANPFEVALVATRSADATFPETGTDLRLRISHADATDAAALYDSGGAAPQTTV